VIYPETSYFGDLKCRIQYPGCHHLEEGVANWSEERSRAKENETNAKAEIAQNTAKQQDKKCRTSPTLKISILPHI